MNKKSVSVLLSFLVLLAAADAKPQYPGYAQKTVVVREERYPGGVQQQTIEQQTFQSGPYGAPLGGSTYSNPGYNYGNNYGKKWKNWKKKNIVGKKYL